LASGYDLKNRTITSIRFNFWPQASDESLLDDHWTIGKSNVKEIREHPAEGEGDKWFYDVYFEDGSVTRIFNVYQVIYESAAL